MKYLIDESTLSAIADSIRAQKGTVEEITPENMPSEINSITAGGGAEVVLQSKTVIPTKTTQEVVSDAGYTALERVTVNPIPDSYIQPSGTKEITENGTHDVTAYASVSVNVSTGSTEPDPRDLYQRVEYIESAEEGTYPYIITDFYADNGTGVEVVASFAVMQDRIPMGSRQDSGATRFYVAYPLSTSNCYYGFNIGSNISCATKVNTVYRLQTNFMNSRQAIIYEANGTRKAFATFTQTLGEHTAPISIFGYNSASSGAVSTKREYRLYSARLSQGFEVVREYIPCYRKSDGVAGVYEKFTGEFLTTPVSAFAVGADIDWEEAE